MKSSKASAKRMNKTRFILSLPPAMSAKKVVAKAAAKNIELTEGYVHSVRALDRNRMKKSSAYSKKGRKGKKAETVFTVPTGATELRVSVGGGGGDLSSRRAKLLEDYKRSAEVLDDSSHEERALEAFSQRSNEDYKSLVWHLGLLAMRSEVQSMSDFLAKQPKVPESYESAVSDLLSRMKGQVK